MPRQSGRGGRRCGQACRDRLPSLVVFSVEAAHPNLPIIVS